jgi:hypothetical protein
LVALDVESHRTSTARRDEVGVVGVGGNGISTELPSLAVTVLKLPLNTLAELLLVALTVLKNAAPVSTLLPFCANLLCPTLKSPTALLLLSAIVVFRNSRPSAGSTMAPHVEQVAPSGSGPVMTLIAMDKFCNGPQKRPVRWHVRPGIWQLLHS